jgi:small conductance mechanosensitive channel
MDRESRLIRNEEDKVPQVMVNAMGASSIDLIVRVWTTSKEYWNVRFDLTKAIKEALDANGITIPFPTRTILTMPAESAEKEKKAV